MLRLFLIFLTEMSKKTTVFTGFQHCVYLSKYVSYYNSKTNY